MRTVKLLDINHAKLAVAKGRAFSKQLMVLRKYRAPAQD